MYISNIIPSTSYLRPREAEARHKELQARVEQQHLLIETLGQNGRAVAIQAQQSEMAVMEVLRRNHGNIEQNIQAA